MTLYLAQLLQRLQCFSERGRKPGSPRLAEGEGSLLVDGDVDGDMDEGACACACRRSRAGQAALLPGPRRVPGRGCGPPLDPGGPGLNRTRRLIA